jgi:hypothetical protein
LIPETVADDTHPQLQFRGNGRPLKLHLPDQEGLPHLPSPENTKVDRNIHIPRRKVQDQQPFKVSIHTPDFTYPLNLKTSPAI